MNLFAHDKPPADPAGHRALRIDNDADLAVLAADGAFDGVDRIELDFPKFTDGRALSQAVLLRRRYRFAGDIRGSGDVLIDLLVHMHRSGFTSAVLPLGQDAAAAARQFARYAAFYQGDVIEPRPHFARNDERQAA